VSYTYWPLLQLTDGQKQYVDDDAFHVIQYELHWAAVTRAQGKLPALLQRLRKRLVSLFNEERPGRKFDRAVKALPQRYAVRVLKIDLN